MSRRLLSVDALVYGANIARQRPATRKKCHLNNSSRVLDVADLRQYIYEQMGRIRTTAVATDVLYGNHNGHGGGIS